MYITTKAVFEWDKDLQKYVEIHNEGYEYEGELELALELGLDIESGWGQESSNMYSTPPGEQTCAPGETGVYPNCYPSISDTSTTGTPLRDEALGELYPTSPSTPTSTTGTSLSDPTYTYEAGEEPTLAGTIDPATMLEGSTLEDDWQKYFTDYADSTAKQEEEMLITQSEVDIGQAETAWDVKYGQLGETYQQEIGGLFGQAGAGMMDLMSSWGGQGAGGVMTGRKGRQRDLYGREVKRGAEKFKLGLEQGREAGELKLGQTLTDIYQGLQADVFGVQTDWADDQRDMLNTLMLKGDIWEDPNAPSEEEVAYKNTPGYKRRKCLKDCEGTLFPDTCKIFC